MKHTDGKKRVCPRCGQPYRGRPAVSRADGRTSICPDCGTREALESIGVGAAEQDSILAAIHRCAEGAVKDEGIRQEPPVDRGPPVRG